MKNSKKRLNFIYRFTKGVKITFLTALFFSMLNILTFAYVPQIVRLTVDSVIGTEPFSNNLSEFITNIGGRDFLLENLYLCGIAVLIVSSISGIFNYFARYNIAKASESFIKHIKDELFTHISKLPLSWHVKHQTGDIIQRCTSDTETVKRFASTQLYEIVKVLFLITFTTILMFSMNVKLTLISAIFIPISLIFTYVFFGKISLKFLDADEKEGALSNVVQENLTGVRVVRAFGREAFELNRFDETNENFAKAWVKMGYTNGFYWGFGDMITSLQILTVVIASTIFTINGDITSGEFIAFVSYNASLTWPIRTLGRMLVDMSKAFVSMDRLTYILDAKEETDCENPKNIALNGDIEFKNVSFSYENDKKVLKNLNFTIKSGETFGILGGTGSGKSTIIHLLNRLYELDETSDISINGTSIKDMSLAHLRKNIGVVLQEPFLFSKSIRDNIGITMDKLNFLDVENVAKIASIDNSIKSFKDGYETIVGERGVTLSGGQKQRVAIARTLLQKTPIIIFDDSLSAVDTETDIKIRKALNENLGEVTVILISHRITTLMEADTILVLNEGEITEFGTHHELLNNNKTYKEIYDIQMSDNR